MRLALVVLLSGASAGAVPDVASAVAPAPPQVEASAPHSAAATTQTRLARAGRLPRFASELADMPRIDGPKGWAQSTRQQALLALARSRPATRQLARWTYARSLIADERFADALGVLEVMLQDDPDLALVANFQLARGVVLVALDRPMDALAALGRDELASNAEACLWRVRALARSNIYDEALREVGCARSAVAARVGSQRVPFLTDMAHAALAKDQPELALRWLAAAPQGDPASNIMRGRAHVALEEYGEARIRLGRAERAGSEAQRFEARLALIEIALAQRTMSDKDARRQVDRIRYLWRGGPTEEGALRLSYRLARKAGDARAAISAGATLVRYFELGPELPALLAEVQGQLAALLNPDNRMPLPQAAGLYWDYRDLMPAGAEGDRLVSRLADRLQAAGLYARAAELLEHQLRHRALDVAQGPLSVRVATLHILAGRPDRAISAVQDTEGTIFPQQMLWDRARIQAVALHQSGKTEQALAVLAEVPGARGLRTELLWKGRDWGRLLAESAPDLPGQGSLSEVKQAVVLRYAIALGMLGKESELLQLRERYEEGFADLPTEPVFHMLTRDPSSVDPASLTRAMSAIPAASPAGAFADLLDVAKSAPQRK